MSNRFPLICFAVKEEAVVFRKTPAAARVQILLVGMGQANAEKAIRKFLAGGASVPASRSAAHESHPTRLARTLAPPSLIITSGFAGGLNPQLLTGDVVFEMDAALHPPPSILHLRPALLAAGAREAKFHFADRVATTAAEKWTLWQQTNADAVEMESGIIQAICREQGIPCVTVRVISDAAGEDLPLDFNALMTPDMRLDGGKLALALLKSPGKIPALLRLQKQTSAAARKLAQVLEAVV